MHSAGPLLAMYSTSHVSRRVALPGGTETSERQGTYPSQFSRLIWDAKQVSNGEQAKPHISTSKDSPSIVQMSMMLSGAGSMVTNGTKMPQESKLEQMSGSALSTVVPSKLKHTPTPAEQAMAQFNPSSDVVSPCVVTRLQSASQLPQGSASDGVVAVTVSRILHAA